MAAPAGSQTRVLLALILGATLGSLTNWAGRRGFIDPNHIDRLVTYLTKPLGDMFISLLFMGIIPLVFASLAVGVTRLGGSNVGRIGVRTIGYFIITTACAATIGLVLVNTVKPGLSIDADLQQKLMRKYSEDESRQKADRQPPKFGIETFVNIVPRNPLRSFLEKEMLAVIFTSLLVGVALTKISPEKAQPVIEVLEGVNEITFFIIRLAMLLAPIGVLALIFTTTALFGVDLLYALGAFMATVLAGLAIQFFFVYPPLVKFLGGMEPWYFFSRSRLALITAFSTSSSSATIPVAMQIAENDLGVPPNVSRFVLPLSASMNHNGTALFEAVTALFLCQVFGVELNLMQQGIVLILCVLTATGMAGVPGGSLPLIGMVVASVAPHVPAAAIGIVIGVDRILDMCRTMVNVTGDLTTAVYVARAERKSLEYAAAVNDIPAEPLE